MTLEELEETLSRLADLCDINAMKCSEAGNKSGFQWYSGEATAYSNACHLINGYKTEEIIKIEGGLDD